MGEILEWFGTEILECILRFLARPTGRLLTFVFSLGNVRVESDAGRVNISEDTADGIGALFWLDLFLALMLYFAWR